MANEENPTELLRRFVTDTAQDIANGQVLSRVEIANRWQEFAGQNNYPAEPTVARTALAKQVAEEFNHQTGRNIIQKRGQAGCVLFDPDNPDGPRVARRKGEVAAVEKYGKRLNRSVDQDDE